MFKGEGVLAKLVAELMILRIAMLKCVLPVLLGLVLAACQGALMPSPKFALEELTVVQGEVRVPYAQAIAPVPPARFYQKTLHVHDHVWTGHLTSSTKWLEPYDFDHDENLSTAEMTQAWLVRTYVWVTGREIPPQAIATSEGRAFGVALSPEAESRLRFKIDELVAGGGALGREVKAAMEAAEKINPDLFDPNGAPFVRQ